MSIPSRLEFVVAGDSRDAVEKTCGQAAWRNLADNGFVERKSVSCVGFHRDVEANSLLVVLPKAFASAAIRERLSEPAFKREQIYRLIRVFKKVRRDTEFSLQDGKSNHQLNKVLPVTDPVLDAFDAAIRLRRDYRENGAYLRKAPRRTLDSPNMPINWPRTVSHCAPVLTGRDLHFSNTIHQARKRDVTHPLCLLHTACLKEIFELTGERNELESLESLGEKEFRVLKERPRNYIRKLRSFTFDERGRFLISAISSFLSASSLLAEQREVKEDLLTYTKDFEDIWEHVLRDLMSPKLSDRTLPVGQWYAWPDSGAEDGMRPEFDIRLTSDDYDVLVDAKDYRLLNGSKWQGSNGDHYKQIIYRQLAASNDAQVINILAFPSFGQKSLFSIRGLHRWKEIEGSRVFEVTVDYDLAVKRWLREISLDTNKEVATLVKALREFGASVERAT